MSGRAATVGEAMGLAEDRARATRPLWETRDLWKDLSRVYSGWELDCHILLRAMQWGVAIDGVSCPVKEDTEDSGESGTAAILGPEAPRVQIVDMMGAPEIEVVAGVPTFPMEGHWVVPVAVRIGQWRQVLGFADMERRSNQEIAERVPKDEDDEGEWLSQSVRDLLDDGLSIATWTRVVSCIIAAASLAVGSWNRTRGAR